jgi:hypothetical protein
MLDQIFLLAVLEADILTPPVHILWQIEVPRIKYNAYVFVGQFFVELFCFNGCYLRYTLDQMSILPWLEGFQITNLADGDWQLKINTIKRGNYDG